MLLVAYFAACLYPCECAAPYFRFPPATHAYEARFYRNYPHLTAPACEVAEWQHWLLNGERQ